MYIVCMVAVLARALVRLFAADQTDHNNNHMTLDESRYIGRGDAKT